MKKKDDIKSTEDRLRQNSQLEGYGYRPKPFMERVNSYMQNYFNKSLCKSYF
jgi:hypothetical protein